MQQSPAASRQPAPRLIASARQLARQCCSPWDARPPAAHSRRSARPRTPARRAPRRPRLVAAARARAAAHWRPHDVRRRIVRCAAPACCAAAAPPTRTASSRRALADQMAAAGLSARQERERVRFSQGRARSEAVPRTTRVRQNRRAVLRCTTPVSRIAPQRGLQRSLQRRCRCAAALTHSMPTA
jgi:hypothetical protein